MSGAGVRLCIAVLAWLVLAGTCVGQLAAGAQGGDRPADEHAWVVTPSTISSEWGLWHVPPRTGMGAAPDGSVRMMDSLERRPAVIAAAGGRVWMAFAGVGNRPGYGMFTAAVQRGAIEGTWFSGSGGRLAASKFLPTEGRLVSMGARRGEPITLLETTAGDYEVAWLNRGQWQFGLGPRPEDDERPQAVGVSEDGQLMLAAVGNGAVTIWTATLPNDDAGATPFELRDPSELLRSASQAADTDANTPITLDWQRRHHELPVSARGSRVAAGPVAIGARTMVAISDSQEVRVLELDGSGSRQVYAAPGHAVVLLAAARRGMIFRLGEEAEGVGGRAATRLSIEEFSLDTGRTLYSGSAVFDGPISPSDLRILLLLMILVSASLLLFVVRSSNESKPFVAPPGCVLAPPMPRVLASVGDGLLAILIGAELARLLPEGWLAIRVGAEMIDFAPLAMALVFGMVAGTVLETLFGRTPGKLVFGLAVTRSSDGPSESPGARRPGLGPSLIRNAVKWLLPLVALAGAMSPLLRHRGDTLSGLAVVGEIVGPEGSGDSDQDSPSEGR